MNCKKCKKEIPEGAIWCCWCGRKQFKEPSKKRRRANGNGMIRKDNRCRNPYHAYTPASESGQGQKYIGAYATYKEAETALAKYLAEIHPNISRDTVAQIYDRWSKVHFPTLTDSGIQGYKAAYKSIEDIHPVQMSEIKTVDFQRIIDGLIASGYSRSKCEKVRQLCSQLCKYAMQNDILDKNYAEFIRLQKIEKKEKQIFTNEDLQTLWEHMGDWRVQVILVMIYMGFRIGEIAAVKPADVFLDKGYIIGGEKTDAGRDRIVPFPEGIPEIRGFIEQWLSEPKGETLLGCSAQSFRTYEFYPCLAELGLIEQGVRNPKTRKLLFKNPRLTPHSTRHTFATLSTKAGLKPENLQKIIGHSSFETTADIYVHQDADVLKTDMSKIKKYV